jgi:uncharacterized membrane protein
MTDIVLARALHVLAVVLWIGGVGMPEFYSSH